MRGAPVALVTCARQPQLTADDRLLAQALEGRGVPSATHPWNASVDWAEFRAVVLRSTWDYHLRHGEFLVWLDGLEARGVPVRNPVRLVRWNAHKRYLRDLRDAGVLVLPTLWLERSARRSLAAVLAEAGWGEAVVKPAVSASAYATWTTTAAQAEQHQAAFDARLAAGDVLVQALAPEVVREGEWSLVFFAGRFSHALLKRPADGDFRVQEEHGGTPQPASPPAAIAAQAAAIVAGLPETATYARVDGVVRDGRFVLMELELIEPALYLRTSPGAAERFADALLDSLC